jgi:tryptophan 7-halogenase
MVFCECGLVNDTDTFDTDVRFFGTTMSVSDAIKKIVIVGGGTAGWMTAAAFARHLGGRFDVQLVESDEIGIVGVGEASIPCIRQFNADLGIKEDDFLRRTQGTFKLGIEFDGWQAPGHSYFHSFDEVGTSTGIVPFYHYWLRYVSQGGRAALSDFSKGALAALQNRFGKTNTAFGDGANTFNYSYHFDAYLYGQFLRKIAEINGVTRIEGKVVDVLLYPENGFIESIQLDSGARIAGDLFIDCSGFRGLLIKEALGEQYDDWSHYLPCNSAWAVASRSSGPSLPYTKSLARKAGWQWRIPLQHRTGNGHVYCSDFVSDDEAAQALLNSLDGEALAEPRKIRFVTGKLQQLWQKNCVGIGLAGGFMEPLESTSIHLVQTAIMRLLKLFPSRAFHQPDIDTFNRESDVELIAIRDFLILHYHTNRRHGLPFWDACRHMPVPDRLADKIALFKSHGRILPDMTCLFAESSWLQVMLGQGIYPQSYHPLADGKSDAALKSHMETARRNAAHSVEQLPLHSAYLAQVLAANSKANTKFSTS